MAQRSGQKDAPLPRVLRLIDEAVEVTKEAETALQTGHERSRTLCTAADQAHGRLLKLICALSESDADLAEPAFTDLENRLFPLYERVPPHPTS